LATARPGENVPVEPEHVDQEQQHPEPEADDEPRGDEKRPERPPDQDTAQKPRPGVEFDPPVVIE
jgi:hypothetical protein